jgi:hypothetical protein
MRTQVNACGLKAAQYRGFLGSVQTDTNVDEQENGAGEGNREMR